MSSGFDVCVNEFSDLSPKKLSSSCLYFSKNSRYLSSDATFFSLHLDPSQNYFVAIYNPFFDKKDPASEVSLRFSFDPEAWICPNECNGHGHCSEGNFCICDPGFLGVDCSTGILIL
jgi:EGF-like domain